MNQVEMNKEAKLSEHLASPSVAALSHSSELNGLHLSPHFKLGELTRSKAHPEIYNVPSRVHIENLKRVCVWLEALRARYNERYVLSEKSPTGARPQGAVSVPGDLVALRGEGAGQSEENQFLEGLTGWGDFTNYSENPPKTFG